MHNAPRRGWQIGCEAIQIFTKNQLQWLESELSDEAIVLFREEFRRAQLRSLIVHASYLINLASPDARTHRKSLRAFIFELRRAEQLSAPFLVVHPGAHMGSGEEGALLRIAGSIDTALRRSNTEHVVVLFETMAGQGTIVGYRFEQLAKIIENCVDSHRVGVCLDSCHIFAAGYDFRTPETFRRMIDEFDGIIGLDRLKALHLNDSRNELGSKVDKHHHIGEGFIGLQGFAQFMNEDRLNGIPMIIETPSGATDDRDTISRLKNLIRPPSCSIKRRTTRR